MSDVAAKQTTKPTTAVSKDVEKARAPRSRKKTMSQGRLILLANFYGSYLDKHKFSAVAIVNNAGIEQLATLGVEKIKEVKANCGNEEVFVLIMAGLTDVLIKSVEEGKNKLEITPNSTQLLETKMQWAHSMLVNEGARIIWAVMPAISLRMYHISEGWNINNIPGMSNGLDKEQKILNSLMINYRNLCMRLNAKDTKRLINGPYFTDLVSELTQDRGSMKLNTGYFESDGISPTSKLVENWAIQVNRVKVAVEKASAQSRPVQSRRTPPMTKQPAASGTGDSWDAPSSQVGIDRNGRGLKRGYDDEHDFSSAARNFRGPARENGYGMGRERMDRERMDRERMDRERMDRERMDRERIHERDGYQGRSRGYSPPPKIPSLVDMAQPFDSARNVSDMASASLSGGSGGLNNSKEMATAVQLLAATMKMGGGNPNNMQTVLSALVAQQQKEQRDQEDRRLEEEKVARAMQRRMEEERGEMVRKQEAMRKMETLKRIEETKRQEEKFRAEMQMRRRDEEKKREQLLIEERRRVDLARRRDEERLRDMEARKKAAEEQRLREIQIAAKLAMEQQKREQDERQQKARLLQEQQAQMALMAVTKSVREQIVQNQASGVSYPATSTSAGSGNVLDRINEKLKIDREKKESLPKKVDPYISNDPAWNNPVVLLSFLNRNKERKPLRGVLGQKITSGSSKASDLKSRGQWIYNEPGAAPLSVGLMKVKVKRAGYLTDYEVKVANFNNRILEMAIECESLIMEGRAGAYIVRRETDDTRSGNKSATTASSSTAKQVKPNSKPDSKPDQTRSASTSQNNRSNSKSQKQAIYTKDLRKNSSNAQKSNSKNSEDPKSTGKTLSSRSSTDAKPRWDKSDDESEDELLWDDEPLPLKSLVIDEDEDEKSTKHSEVKVVDLVSDDPGDDNVDAEDNINAESPVKEVSTVKKEDAGELPKNDDFITLDDTADDGKMEEESTLAQGDDANSFVTIDEAA